MFRQAAQLSRASELAALTLAVLYSQSLCFGVQFHATTFEYCMVELLIWTLHLAFATVPITRFQEVPDVHINSTGSFSRAKQISSLSCAWQHLTFLTVHPYHLA